MEFIPSAFELGIFKFFRELVLFYLHLSDLSLKIKNFFSFFGDFDELPLCDSDFPLVLGDFNFDHPDLVFNIFDIHLGGPEDIFLDVGLLVQNAQLVVSVNELNSCKISVLAGQLVLFSQTLHIGLKGINDHVQFLYLVGVLIHLLFLFFLLEIVFVQFGLGLISFVDLELQHVIVVLDCFVFLCALVFEDLKFILKDFYSLLQFG